MSPTGAIFLRQPSATLCLIKPTEMNEITKTLNSEGNLSWTVPYKKEKSKARTHQTNGKY